MLSLAPTEIAHLAARKPVRTRFLVWVTAKSFSTGAIEEMGLWTGDDHQAFMVDGIARDYFGAGNILELDGISRAASLEVRMHQIKLSPLSPEVITLIRGYDVRLAPVLIHRARFDPGTNALLAPPFRIFKGWVETLEITTGPDADCMVKIASNARAGTRGLTLKKSDASQRLRRLPDDREDRFYQYSDISGSVPVKWGEE